MLNYYNIPMVFQWNVGKRLIGILLEFHIPTTGKSPWNISKFPIGKLLSYSNDIQTFFRMKILKFKILIFGLFGQLKIIITTRLTYSYRFLKLPLHLVLWKCRRVLWLVPVGPWIKSQLLYHCATAACDNCYEKLIYLNFSNIQLMADH
jgi:hypothetical protein